MIFSCFVPGGVASAMLEVGGIFPRALLAALQEAEQKAEAEAAATAKEAKEVAERTRKELEGLAQAKKAAVANYAILLYWLRWCSATAVPGSRPVIFTAPRRAYRTASAQSALASDGHVRARCPDLCAFGCTPACVGDACGKHACLIRLFAVPPPLQHILARFCIFVD